LGTHTASSSSTQRVASGSMRKALLAFVFVMFLAPFSFGHAQLGNFVVMQQSDRSSVSSDYSSGAASVYVLRMGQGFSATSTSAFVSADFKYVSGNAILFELFQYTDAAYSSSVGVCDFGTLSQTGGNYYSATTTGFIQLDHIVADDSGFGCGIQPSSYVALRIVYQHATFVSGNTRYYGSNATSSSITVDYTNSSRIDPNVVIPQFAVVTNGFTITATSTAIGLSSLSGAQSFCNSQFGTSTGGIFGIGTDLANGICQVGLFLFIPSTAALGDFQQIPLTLQSKFPFAWGFAIKDLLSSLSTTTSANYPTVSYAIGTTTPGYYQNIVGSGLSIATPTTIQNLAADSVWTTIRYLIGVILWISFAYFVYRKAMGIWHVQT